MSDFENLIIAVFIMLVVVVAYRMGLLDQWIHPKAKLYERKAEDMEGALVEFKMGGEKVVQRIDTAILDGDILRAKFVDSEQEVPFPLKYLSANKPAIAIRNPDEPALTTDYDTLTGKPGPLALNEESANAYLLDIANADNEYLKKELHSTLTARNEQIKEMIKLNKEWKTSLIAPSSSFAGKFKEGQMEKGD